MGKWVYVKIINYGKYYMIGEITDYSNFDLINSRFRNFTFIIIVFTLMIVYYINEYNILFNS